MQPDSVFIEQRFLFPGTVVDISTLGTGHIHDTYLITCSDKEGSKFVLQKFNHQVFTNPVQVMSNIAKVLGYLHKSSDLEPIQIINTRKGNLIYQSDKGDFWRVFSYLNNSESFDQLENQHQAKEAASAFGSFLSVLDGLSPDELFTTIADFHNLAVRFEQLKNIKNSDAKKRLERCSKEVGFAMSRENQVKEYCMFLNHPDIPQRVTHNDTKINNILFRKGTTRAIGVIDLDTVMPGLLLYDFGDMARTFCPSALEEDKVNLPVFRMDYFDALCEGFFNSFQSALLPAEITSLRAGPWWMTFIMGIRFLTDYLAGDVYYKTDYPGQNLNRANNQFTLLSDIEKKQLQIDETIGRYL